ncbi:NADH:flavin oxidoreductase/NADH oxidase [Pusillimonas sp. TS35]|uniref:NADH:flavin oxidoreductase/NADH oxidase n=1 Tax=Paracandidimonas lactea TaxID=2895524 RepID=UPI00136E546B|nr:NADH:flavin oxidoreductase/NADH oxidase [Paracandidimonas lactea]MYN14298.1 NADH:flavin oxidoreductase/NADH oxidase [Pusillimonas sp. TS35]
MYQAELPSPRLFEPLRLRDIRLKNRLVLGPMQMYVGENGHLTDWHFQHLAKYAVGGFGTVFTEGLCVEQRGRNTYGDLGVWSDEFVPNLRRLAGSLRALGASPAAQLLHTGPKACRQRPWEGYGMLGPTQFAKGEHPWTPIAPSAVLKNPGWLPPAKIREDEIPAIVEAFASAARRCAQADFDILEVHAAHGYLIHSFYSPLGNDMDGRYGGDRPGRMRLALEIARACRRNWPDHKPLFFRLSCVDGAERDGWTIEDTVVLAAELRRCGVDLIDCSSGGIGRFSTAQVTARPPMFQVSYAERVRKENPGLPTMAVGLITEPAQAEHILENEQADLVMLAREALYNPHWPLQAAVALGGPEFYNHVWPPQYGWWLYRRARSQALLTQQTSEHS